MSLLLLLKYIGHKEKVANGSVYTRPFTVTAPVSAMHLPRKLVIGFQTLFHPIILPLLSKFSLPGIISQVSSNNPYSPFENPFLKLFLSGSEASSRAFRNPLPLHTPNSTEMVVSPHRRWAIHLCMFGAQQQRLAYSKCLKQFTQMHLIVRAGNITPKVTVLFLNHFSYIRDIGTQTWEPWGQSLCPSSVLLGPITSMGLHREYLRLALWFQVQKCQGRFWLVPEPTDCGLGNRVM